MSTKCTICGGTGQDDPPPGKYHGICPVCKGKKPNTEAETTVQSDDSSPCRVCGTLELNGNCEKCNPTPRWKL